MKLPINLSKTIVSLALPLLVLPVLPHVAFAADASTQDIVVTASRVEVAREESGSAISIIDSDYLEQNQTRIVSDVLRDVPGLAVSRSGAPGGLTQVRIRGAEGNQTLVLIDGIEVNDIASGSEFDFADLVNLDIERIEVLRGAQSALWGSDAMGGVINIITKKGQGDLSGRATFEGGSFGTYRDTLNISAGDERYHFSLSRSLLKTSGISSADEDNGNTEDDGYENLTVNLKSGYKFNDIFSIDASLRHVKADAETDGFAGGVGAFDADENAETEQTFGLIAANLNLLDGAWQHTWRISGNNTENESFATGTLTFLSEGKKRKNEYQTSYLVSSDDWQHRFTFAAERETDEFLSQSTFSTLNRRTDNKGFVFEYGANINDRIYATVSGRRDVNDIFQNANTHRFSLAAWATDNVRLHASQGRGIKNPTMFELFGFAANFTGNPNLQPERNRTWDAGTEFHFDQFEGYVDLTYFRSDIDNLIVGFGQTAVNSATDSEIKGFELSVVTNPTDNLRVNASYTYTDSDDGTGRELVRRAKHTASLNSSYTFNDERSSVTGGVQYNGSQDDFEFDAMFNRTQVPLESYVLVNLAASHKVNDKVELFARVENLTDKDYEDVLTYGTKGRGAFVGIRIDDLF